MKQFALVTTAIVISVLLTAGLSPSLATLSLKNGMDGDEYPQYDPKSNFVFELSNTLPEGFHDNSFGSQNQYYCVADGWATDPDDRNIDLNVRVLSDSVQVAETVADNFRPDLEDAGVCPSGTCGFVIDLWGLVSHDVDHSIAIQAQDAQTGEWTNLSDTPKMLNCVEPHAQTFVVNSTTDSGDSNWGNGICETSTPGVCTLRAAIEESNSNPGTDSISFNIPGAGPYTISPSYGFDFIIDPVIIDGTTQPGFAGTPIIELDGSNAGTDAYGIVIFAGSSAVRGLVINRFSLTGVDLDVNGGNVIQGNYIGTDITGTLGLGNGVNGIAISQGSAGNMIGGTTAEERNIIAGNGEYGIIIVDPGSTGNVIQGNYVGTDTTGTLELGNVYDGILLGIGASDNMVGGTEVGAGNTIAFGGWNGVGLAADAGTGNTISSNVIYSNAGLGIDLSDDGVTLKDLFDWDGGPNNLQNFATIAAAKSNGTTTKVNIKLSSTPNTIFRIELFSAAACDPSGYGEGNTFLGFVDATTNAGGQANMTVTLAMSLPVGSFVTTTATDPNGNTSEFSQCGMVSQAH